MSTNLKICAIDEDLLKKLKKFRFRKATNNAAIIMKINKETKTIVEDVLDDDEEYLMDVTPEEVAEQLSEHQARYIAYSYCLKHQDGRISYPLCFVFISPSGANPELQMMYAGSKLSLVQAGEFTKVFELRALDEFTEEWLIEKLRFFR